MQQTQPQRLKSSSKRLREKVDAAFPPVVNERDRVEMILSAVESVCYKLERVLDHQNNKIRSLEARSQDHLIEKFDRLIEANEKMVRLLERNSLRSPLKFRLQTKLQQQDQQKGQQITDRNHLLGLPKLGEIQRKQQQTSNNTSNSRERKAILKSEVAKNEQEYKVDLSHVQKTQSKEQSKEDVPIPQPYSPQLKREASAIMQKGIQAEQKLQRMASMMITNKSIVEQNDRRYAPAFFQNREMSSSRVVEHHFMTNSPSKVAISDGGLTALDDYKNIEVHAPPPTIPEAQNPQPQAILSLPMTMEQFTGYVMGRLRDFYMNLTERKYQEFTTGKIDYKQLKVTYAWQCMDFYLNLNRDITNGPTELQNLTKRIPFTKLIDKTIRKILQFLVKKYPPTRNKILDTELASRIQQVNRQSDLNNDILLNAGMSFTTDDKNMRDYTKGIKTWLNKIISHTKQKYPSFKQTVKKLFVDDQSIAEGEIMEHDVEYEINSKINEMTPLYTEEELSMPGLQLKSPQLLRILVKWTEQLMSNFVQTESKIIQNKSGFKSTIQGLIINLTYNRKETLAKNLKQLFDENIKIRLSNTQKYMYNIINQLLNVSFLGFSGFEYLNEKEVLIPKLSQYFSECAQTYTLKLLNNLLSSLNQIRVKYQKQVLQSSIDLITFNVMDLMRCRCIGSRKQILRIYKDLTNRKDEFEIVRIKNKLNTSTRDILINFRLKESFLVCQMQLALGDSKDQVNDHFCHNLYEMQRSIFPVLFENANHVVNLDTRVAFMDQQKIIQFKKNPQFGRNILKITNQKVFCVKSHEQNEMVFHSKSSPYCCWFCSKFVASYSFQLEYLRCYKCMVAICPQCLLTECPEFLITYVNRYSRISEFIDFLIPHPYYSAFGKMSSILQKIGEALKEHPYVILNSFDTQNLKVNAFKKYKGRIINTLITVDGISSQRVVDSIFNWHIVWIPETPQKIVLRDFKYYHKSSLLANMPWFQVQQILKNQQEIICVMNKHEKRILLLDIQQRQNELDMVLTKADIMKHLNNENRKMQLNLELTTKNLKDLSVLDIIERKTAVKSLNLWENQISQVFPIKSFTRMQQLNMRQNHLTSMRQILYLVNIQYLDLHHNKISGDLPVLNFQFLKTLDISQNNIENMSNMANSSLPSLLILHINQNKIRELPVLVCPQLQIYFFSHNKVENLDNLVLSRIPKIRKIYGYNNELDFRLPDILFEKLQTIELDHNKIQDIENISKWSINTLESLKLNHNHIAGELPMISNLTGLKKLDLSHNRMTGIGKLEYMKLQNMVQLDISVNNLEGSLPLMDLPSLEKLSINFNKLNNVSSLEKSNLPMLRQVHFSSNVIKNLPKLSLPSLKYIEMSNNHLTSIELMGEWKLSQIEIVRLNSNYISGPIPIMFLDKLKELYLDSNDITTMDCFKEKQLIPSIKIVSVKNNKTYLEDYKNIQTNPAIRSYYRSPTGVWRVKNKPVTYNEEGFKEIQLEKII